MDKGFYIGIRQDETIGFSFAIVYLKENKDFQIALQIWDLMLAVGYNF